MMNLQLVSVIIAVYNVEKYLKKCIESVINQTYKNMEIFLVDDGSTDNSSKICNDYKKMDSRIKVIHKKNGGVSSARNVALDRASGKYVTFIDSDDWVSENWIEFLVNSIEKHNSSVSIGEICCCSAARKSYIEFVGDEEVIDAPNQMIKYITEQNIRSTATNKLYYLSLFENLRFPEGKINEDAYITHQIIGESERISFAKDCYYYIRIRSGSITQQHFSVKNLDLLYASDNMEKYYLDKYPQFEKLVLAHSINEISVLLNALFASKKDDNFLDIESQLKTILQDKTRIYDNAKGETYNYSISDDVYLYLSDRKKYIQKCKKNARVNMARKMAVKGLSVLKFKRY